ncbi:MAG: SH3 domain-containing protein [Anaerolineaceae bacterium]
MISGKGFYIWKLDTIEIPSIPELVQTAKAGGFSHLIVKIADGSVSANISSRGDLAAQLVKEAHKVGIQVWGFQYLYCTFPEYEAVKAKKRVIETGVDGFVIDAEAELKLAGPEAAKVYLTELKKGWSGIPIALSSYRYPSFHREFPWKEFMSQVDLAMPQVYWAGAHNPKAQLEQCLKEYRANWPKIPVIPTGAAYHEAGWQPAGGEITAFIEAVQKAGLPGYNFWEWANALRYGLFAETVGGNPAPTTPTELSMAIVKTGLINFRSDAAIGNNVIVQLKRGTQGKIVEVKQEGKNRWVKVQVEGWLAADYNGQQLVEVK